MTVTKVPLYTARFHSPATAASKLPKVAITVGNPRFLEYDVVDKIKSLAPYGGVLKIEDRDEFTRALVARLERPGILTHVIGRVNEIATWTQSAGLVLCCFEDFEKNPKTWCHREIVAAWWERQTGDVMYEMTNAGMFVRHRDLHWPDALPDPQQALEL
ncbi:MAG: hypothetical protein M3R48_05725 [Candidatus Dormibacteraeota bacterium]|nr:hypothetical protein [Candidatus Dormibacteraeota bacterium]